MSDYGSYVTIDVGQNTGTLLCALCYAFELKKADFQHLLSARPTQEPALAGGLTQGLGEPGNAEKSPRGITSNGATSGP